ncbi:MAG: hypothetical protein AAB834_04005, partial [Patescibacteria group bacterium]
DQLGFHRDSAANTRTALDKSVANHLTRARDARLRGNVSMVTHRDTTLHQDAHPLPVATTDKEKAERAASATLRSVAVRESVWASIQDTIAARKAAQERDLRVTARSMIEGFDQSIAAVLNHESDRHQAIRDRVDAYVRDTTVELGFWGIQEGEDYPGQDSYVRQRLEELRGILENPNELGVHDSARAEAIGDYVRLRYRVEARGINHADPHGHQATYTPDRGIRVNLGTPDDTVLYENGDMIRVGAGETARRNPAGHEVHPDDVDLVDLTEPVTIPAAPLETTVADWEERRTPESGAEAHAALSQYISHLEAQEPAWAARADAIRAQLLQPNHPTTAARLRAEGAAIDGQRSRLNSAKYLLGFIETAAIRPDEPQQRRARRLGRATLRRSAEMETPSEPQLLRDGSLWWDGMTIHGIRGNWRLYPNGYATHLDPATGQSAGFFPNGHRDPRPIHRHPRRTR